MKTGRLTLLLLFPVLAASAAGGPEPIVQPGFTLQPPAEGDWQLLQRGRLYLQLGRDGQHDGERYGVTVSLDSVPLYRSERAFLDAVRSARARELAGRALVTIDDTARLQSYRDTTCVHFRTRYRAADGDHGSAIDGELIGYQCLHPRDRRVALRLEYQHDYGARRGTGDVADTADAALVKGFMDGLEFTGF